MDAPALDLMISIDQAAPIGPQVYRLLRQQIIRAQLLPGTLLSESECARRFSISRQPIREAFIKLSEMGLVEVRPQRGTLVCKISQAAVLQARFVREAIEADVVREVARRNDTAVIRELRRQLDRQRDTIGSGSAEFLALDELFHRSLAEAAGVPYAWDVVEESKAQMDRVRYLSFLHMPTPKLVAQHSDIVDAIERADVDGAEQGIRTHLREILADLPEISKEHPELFA